jgi:transcriptional regulator with XRE-family HTH domain
MGLVLREARCRAGVSLTQMAQRTNFSKSYLGLLETGKRTVTREVVKHYERALNVTGLDDDMNRRELLLAAAGLAATEPLIRLVDGLSFPVAALPSRVGMSEVAAVRQAADFYKAMDFRHGGAVAVDVASGALRWAVTLLDGSMRAEVRNALLSAIGTLADCIAWAHHDSGRGHEALKTATLAIRTATEGGDRTLRAHILLNTASIAGKNSPDDAVQMLRPTLTDNRVYPLERANLHLGYARHLARAGRPDEALVHLGKGEALMTTGASSEPPEWAGFLSPAHLDSVMGWSLMRTAQAMDSHSAASTRQAAVERLTSAFDQFGPERSRGKAHLLIRIASVRLEQGEHSEAHRLAAQADALLANVRSTRVRASYDQLRFALEQAGR